MNISRAAQNNNPSINIDILGCLFILLVCGRVCTCMLVHGPIKKAVTMRIVVT